MSLVRLIDQASDFTLLSGTLASGTSRNIHELPKIHEVAISVSINGNTVTL